MPKEQRSKPFLSLQDVKEAATETLLANGSHASLLIADGDQQTIYTHMDQIAPTSDERITQMLLLGRLLAETREVGVLHQVFFISEAWMSLTERHSSDRSPYEDPQHKEILIVSQRVLKPLQRQLALVEMKRDTNGTLVSVEEMLLDTRANLNIQSPLLDAVVLGFLGIRPRNGTS